MKILFTIGDVNGVGLETFFKAVSYIDADFFEDAEFSIAGAGETVENYASKIHFDLRAEGDVLNVSGRKIRLVECGEKCDINFGKVSAAAGALASQSIETAVEKTLEGKFDAIVTLPVSKTALYKAGWIFPGHTEMLAKRCGVEKPLMILFADGIRAALATVHIPLSRVAEEITREELIEKIRLFDASLRLDFGVKTPRIAALALNPHAGEDGSLGKEELYTLIPALNDLRSAEIAVDGPIPADGFFAHEAYRGYDGYMAMYHDQGLIPLKLIAKGKGVNFTAGLPIVRVSPDHGSAFEIAGRGFASPDSLIAAIYSAKSIIENRKNYEKK